MPELAPELSTLTRGKTTARVLALLTSTPGQSFHTREIIRRAGTTDHPTQRALTLLEEQGLIQSRRVANLRLWTMSTQHPLYATLRTLFARTIGLAEQLRIAFAGQQIDLAFIFGSYASSTDDRTSDVDLFVFGQVDWDNVRSASGDVLDRFGRELRPVVWSEADLRRAIKVRSPFLTTLRASEKIWVIGDDREFERWIGDLGKQVRRIDPERQARQGGRQRQTSSGPKERGTRASKPKERRP